MTWDPQDGVRFDEEAKKEIFDQLAENYISGITFSGGDPLFPANEAEVTELARDDSRKISGKKQSGCTPDISGRR